MNKDVLKALELMVYPRHVCVDPGFRGSEECAECGKNWRNTDRHFRVGESFESDKIFAIATLHKAKLEAVTRPSVTSHVEKMQAKVIAYLTSELSAEEFINDIIYLLDGPEQREVMAA